MLVVATHPIGDGLAAPFRVRDASGYIDTDDGHAAPLVADFDGDGLPDLLVGQYNPGKLRIYKNVGTAKEPRFYGFSWFKAGGEEVRVPIGGGVGFGPQFADLDGDGIPDVVSGSYTPGDIYFFRGLGKGNYASGDKLEFPGGMPVRAGLASAVALADWNRDGRIDLIIGNFHGEVWFLPNRSEDHRLLFGPGQAVVAGGDKIDVKFGAGPLVADWNGDGIPDLLVGAYDGSVTLYAGRGKSGIPVLGKGTTLVAGIPESRRDAILRERDPKTGEWLLPELERPSLNSKLAVCDWNGDGRLDLLVGDEVSMGGPAPALDDAKKQERDELEKQSESVAGSISYLSSTTWDRIWKELRQQNPETDESTLGGMVRKQVDDVLLKDEQHFELTSRLEEIRKKLSPLKGDRSRHGFVWVYLRTANSS